MSRRVQREAEEEEEDRGSCNEVRREDMHFQCVCVCACVRGCVSPVCPCSCETTGPVSVQSVCPSSSRPPLSSGPAPLRLNRALSGAGTEQNGTRTVCACVKCLIPLYIVSHVHVYKHALHVYMQMDMINDRRACDQVCFASSYMHLYSYCIFSRAR